MSNPSRAHGKISSCGSITQRQRCLWSRAQSLVLENLAHPFFKPNILDIKLGTVLYDEDAPPDKVARMLKTAETTTSLKTGMRLTGFQVTAAVFEHQEKED